MLPFLGPMEDDKGEAAKMAFSWQPGVKWEQLQES